MTKKDNLKLEQENKVLRKEQDTLSNSINQLKEERDLFENKNKFLKDEISKKNKLIVYGEPALADIKIKIDNVIKKCEIEDIKLNEVMSQKEDANLRLSNLNSAISTQQKIYDEDKKVSDKQLEQLETKRRFKIRDLDDEFIKYQEVIEKEKILIQEKLVELKKQDGTLQAIVNSLIVGEQDLRQNITDLEKEKKQLEGIVQRGNETSLDLISKNEMIERLVKENGSVLGSLNAELKKTREDLKTAKVGLDRILKKIGFIQTKEDNLKSFEQYIIETSNKYGLSYQPYEG